MCTFAWLLEWCLLPKMRWNMCMLQCGGDGESVTLTVTGAWNEMSLDNRTLSLTFVLFSYIRLLCPVLSTLFVCVPPSLFLSVCFCGTNGNALKNSLDMMNLYAVFPCQRVFSIQYQSEFPTEFYLSHFSFVSSSSFFLWKSKNCRHSFLSNVATHCVQGTVYHDNFIWTKIQNFFAVPPNIRSNRFVTHKLYV